MKRIFLINLIAVIFLYPLTAAADIYKHVDAQGRIYFTDTPKDSNYTLYMKTGRSKLDRLITHYAEMFELDESLIRAVIKVESDFNPDAVSSKGAQGLMQIMPATAKYLGIEDPFDPHDAIYGGGMYLREQLDRFGKLELALAAYNAGPSAVEQYGGIPPYEETQNYVTKVKRYLDHYRSSND